MKNEQAYLVHIVEAGERISEYVAAGREYFVQDTKTQDAVIRVLANLTESAAKLSDEVKSLHPDVPWDAIKAFRNVLVHEYLGTLDLDEVWDIIQADLPVLISKARKILKEKYGLEL